MEEKIVLSIQNPKDVLISYVDIYLGDKNVSLEVLSNDTTKINLPFDKDEGEGEIIVKIRYKTLPNQEQKQKNQIQTTIKDQVINKNVISENNCKVEEKHRINEHINKNKNEYKEFGDIIVAESDPNSLKEIKEKEKKKKYSDIIIV
ncbi:conserved hypothetical protein [Methanocaldococcus vulcanius M7]|uniref:Uncharacterized protein n=1 Tax=Methanocaldococcus vulcanius (strain ATCC 700851 / DSM 12094 / M7) TaxID=579137 RepID=C9RID0_METVM|nr:hypothetical protein [Methanocaldococcus vulcanius]ACX73332.1 conserved hypothetical protein [Methanocaldococcus vulcanius M7]